MKKTTKRPRMRQRSIVELDLNTRRCKERPLGRQRAIRLPFFNERIAAVRGLTGFHFTITEHEDVVLFQIAKHGVELITGAVVWGEDDLLFGWLVAYRAAHSFRIPGSVWTFPRPTRYPWSAFVPNPLVARLSQVERRRVHQFRENLVDALILGQAN
jgi:hypothetical protein